MIKVNSMMTHRFVTFLFIVAGLINFAPLVGVLGDSLIENAYGIEVASNDLSLLLRHRAALFGIVGGLLLVAAFRPTIRTTATVCGFASMISFLILYGLIQPTGPALTGILRLDIVGIIALGAAVLLDWRVRLS